MLAAVFLMSLSSIAFEILLTRIFSISQWNHLSFMVISIALFGLAASGTVLSILHGKHGSSPIDFVADRDLPRLIFFYAASTALSFLFTNRLPLDYFKLPIQPVQMFYLFVVFVFLALPFFFAGMIISTAYIWIPRKTGYVYFTSMCGSAAGALIPLTLMHRFDEGRLVILAAAIPLLVCLILPAQAFMRKTSSYWSVKNRMSQAYTIAGIVLALVLTFLLIGNPSMIHVVPSEYKSLSQMLQMPETKISETSRSIRGRIDKVQSPFLRFFPGLSLNYDHPLPSQFTVLKDGDQPLVCYAKEPKGLSFSRHTLSYAGYMIGGIPKNVLIIQNGGGTAIPCAVSAKAKHITVIEKTPRFAEIIGRHYGMTVLSRSFRPFLSGSSATYDIIHLENWGTSLPGTSALSQDYMFSVQSFNSYFDHLADDGLLLVSRRLLLPPSNLIRMCATVVESLKSFQITNPRRHIIILRNWDTFTLIVARRPVQNMEAVTKFAMAHSFDFVWPHDPELPLINRYNQFEKPFHYIAVKNLLNAYETSSQSDYYKNYALDVLPQNDHRPFPDKFFKWTKARLIHEMTGQRLYTLLMSGEIVVAVVFLEALCVSAFLLLMPLFIFGRRNKRISLKRAVYFLCIGAGFILFEIFFINTYTLIYNDPVISFAAVLSGILVFSSAGGIWSQFLKPAALRRMIGFLCALLIFFIAFMDVLFDHMMSLSDPVCFLVSMLLMLPAGLFLGVPFPMGMRFLLDIPGHRAYAWAVNGCASVLASVAAAQLSISLGFKTLLVAAFFCYAGAWVTAKVR